MTSHDKIEALNSWWHKNSNILDQFLLGLSQSGIVLIIIYRRDSVHSSFWDVYIYTQCGCCCTDWMSSIPGGKV